MNTSHLQALLEDVQRGTLTPAAAQERVLQFLRQVPLFEDLGFARVDHHRALRQGFPEVVFGPGKTPEQIAEISSRIVARGHSLIVTRVDRGAYDAVRARLADHHTRLEHYRLLMKRDYPVPPDRSALAGLELDQYLVLRGGILMEETWIAWLTEYLEAHQ